MLQDIHGELARKTVERISHTCGAGVPSKTGFSFSFASCIHLRSGSLIIAFTYAYNNAQAQIFRACPILNIFYTLFVSKDFRYTLTKIRFLLVFHETRRNCKIFINYPDSNIRLYSRIKFYV